MKRRMFAFALRRDSNQSSKKLPQLKPGLHDKILPCRSRLSLVMRRECGRTLALVGPIPQHPIT